MEGADGWLATDGAVPLEDVVYTATHAVHDSLLRLAHQLGARMTEPHRRRALREGLALSRSLLERVLMLVRWASDSHAHALACSAELTDALEQQASIRRVADDLFHMHQAMPLASAPAPDVFAALDVLSSGTYSQLPRSIRAPVPEKPPTRRETCCALRWLRGEIRKKRSHWRLPSGLHVNALRGAIHCVVDGEYELAMTAEGASGSIGWRLIRLRINTGATARLADHGLATPAHWRRLWLEVEEVLGRRPRQPMLLVHPSLHAACAQLGLVRLRAQAASLARHAWARRLSSNAKLGPTGTILSLVLDYHFSAVHAFGSHGTVASADAAGVPLGRSSLTIRPAPSHGLEISHMPPIPRVETPGPVGKMASHSSLAAKGSFLREDWEPLSLSDLDVESILLNAIRARSKASLDALRTSLRRCPVRKPATIDALQVSGAVDVDPAEIFSHSGIGDGTQDASSEEKAAVPLLRISRDLAVVHRPANGRAALLGEAAGLVGPLFQTSGQTIGARLSVAPVGEGEMHGAALALQLAGLRTVIAAAGRALGLEPLSGALPSMPERSTAPNNATVRLTAKCRLDNYFILPSLPDHVLRASILVHEGDDETAPDEPQFEHSLLRLAAHSTRERCFSLQPRHVVSALLVWSSFEPLGNDFDLNLANSTSGTSATGISGRDCFPSWMGLSDDWEDIGEQGIQTAERRAVASLRIAHTLSQQIARRDVVLAQLDDMKLVAQVLPFESSSGQHLAAARKAFAAASSGIQLCARAATANEEISCSLHTSRNESEASAVFASESFVSIGSNRAPLVRLCPGGAWVASFPFNGLEPENESIVGPTASNASVRCDRGLCFFEYPVLTSHSIRVLMIDLEALHLVERFVGQLSRMASTSTSVALGARVLHASASAIAVECKDGRVLEVSFAVAYCDGKQADRPVEGDAPPVLAIQVTIDGEEPASTRLQSAALEIRKYGSLQAMIVEIAS